MEPVRWGVLGAAKFAAEHMAPAICAAKGAVLQGLATSSGARAEAFRAMNPDIEVFDSYDAILAAPQIDAVFIPLPNHLHVAWTAKALDAGKPVLCEKPIAMQAAEIESLIALRDKTGLLAAEAYMIVHHPQWQRARDLVQSGEIGIVRHVDGFFSYDNSSDPGNIRNRPETGGGSLPDIGVYTIGSARFVTGQEPTDIVADIVWENDVDVTCHMVARLGEARFQATTSMRHHPRQEMTFHGTDGLLRLTAPFNAGVFGEARVELHRNAHASGGPPRIIEERWPAVNHYVLQVEAFGRTLREGACYPWTLEDAKGTQLAIEAALSAGRS